MSRRTTLTVVAVVVAAAVVALVVLAGGGGTGLAPEAGTGQVEEVSPGVAVVPDGQRQPLPAFTGRTLDNQEIDLASLRGRPLVLNFWASWCTPACYEEAPVLERGWRAFRARDVMVVGVDIQDTPEAARKFMEQFSLTFPNARDLTGKVSIDYGVYGVPETFFIDRQGRIRAKHVGAVTDTVFRANVESLLETRTPSP